MGLSDTSSRSKTRPVACDKKPVVFLSSVCSKHTQSWGLGLVLVHSQQRYDNGSLVPASSSVSALVVELSYLLPLYSPGQTQAVLASVFRSSHWCWTALF